MDPKRWQQIEQIFQAFNQLPPDRQTEFLEERCGDDEDLKKEVRSLLSAQDEVGEFMSAPPLKKSFNLDTVSALLNKEVLSLLGTEIGAYRLEKVIATGGMGTVYLASRIDRSFEKKVAVKLIRGGLQNREIVQRFYRERQILATLDHPNIARLLDGGSTDEGHPYLVMEYIEGLTIDVFCDTRKLSISERLKLFRQVCSAVQFAHGKLIVHRDIKPGNILVTREGIPKLLDFGIVKILDPESRNTGTLTLTMQRVMTPEYASPEQVRGDTISTTTDVYSLGIVLYELLTGHRPYSIETISARELERMICEEDPPKPSTAVTREVESFSHDGRKKTVTPDTVSRTREGRPERLRRRLEGDLDHIVMKALRKEPDKRYVSVEHFSEDIRRHL
ncbi:MAG: serine/threonine protein kinase, partial [Planctomycetes bacterium]|nr:serine/threonine protein kinase [Planctomycetota bacterium]